jgi:hypothetical protein
MKIIAHFIDGAMSVEFVAGDPGEEKFLELFEGINYCDATVNRTSGDWDNKRVVRSITFKLEKRGFQDLKPLLLTLAGALGDAKNIIDAQPAGEMAKHAVTYEHIVDAVRDFNSWQARPQ